MVNQPKSMMKKLNRLIGISITILLISCGQQKNDPTANVNQPYPSQSGGALVDAMSGEPSGLIAMMAGESSASAIASNIFNSLLKYDKNLELTGELAQSWDVSSDQKTITFHLKPNLKWADGHALTSDDVLFTWKTVTDDKTRSPYGADYKLVKRLKRPILVRSKSPMKPHMLLP